MFKQKRYAFIAFVVSVLIIGILTYCIWGSAPKNVLVSNVTDRSVTISWVTKAKTPGVALLLSESAPSIKLLQTGGVPGYDDRDHSAAEIALANKNRKKATNTDNGSGLSVDSIETEVKVTKKGRYYVHHVTVTDLDPSTSYSIMVGNGWFFRGVRDAITRKTAVTTFTQRETLATPYPAYGQVVAIDGQLSDEGVVYLILRHADGTDAQILSSAVNPNNGTFYFDLSNALSSDGEYLGEVTEALTEEVWVEAGPNGRLMPMTVLTGQDAPMNLMQLYDVTELFDYEALSTDGMSSLLTDQVYAEDSCDPCCPALFGECFDGDGDNLSDDRRLLCIDGVTIAQGGFRIDDSYCIGTADPSITDEPDVQTSNLPNDDSGSPPPVIPNDCYENGIQVDCGKGAWCEAGTDDGFYSCHCPGGQYPNGSWYYPFVVHKSEGSTTCPDSPNNGSISPQELPDDAQNCGGRNCWGSFGACVNYKSMAGGECVDLSTTGCRDEVVGYPSGACWKPPQETSTNVKPCGGGKRCTKPSSCDGMSTDDPWMWDCETGTECDNNTDGNTYCGSPRDPNAAPATPESADSSASELSRLFASLKFQISAQVPESSQNVLYDPQSGQYFVYINGEYQFQYQGVTYTVLLPEEGKSYSIFLDNNLNGILDPGETTLSEDASLLNLELVADVVTYSLKAGLNFVSFPMVLVGENTASTLLAGLNERYDNAFYSISKFRSTWNVVGENGGQYNVNDFQIVPGQGYILKSKINLDIELTGKQVIYESEGDSAPIYLTPGWNLVGLYGTGTKAYTAESMIDSVNLYEPIDFNADNVTRWPIEKGRYEGFQKTGSETFGFDFPLDQQTAYFVRVLQGQGNWEPERK